MDQLIRYNGKWYKINSKKYESESQTIKIAWDLVRNSNLKSEDAYINYFNNRREENKILYPDFRKE